MTAIELMRRLAELDPQTAICFEDYDLEYGTTSVYGISAVDDDGELTRSRRLTSWEGEDALDPINLAHVGVHRG